MNECTDKLFVWGDEKSIPKLLNIVKKNFFGYKCIIVVSLGGSLSRIKSKKIRIINFPTIIENVEDRIEVNDIPYKIVNELSFRLIDALIIQGEISKETKNDFLFYNYKHFYLVDAIRSKCESFPIRTFTFIDSFYWENLASNKYFFRQLRKLMYNRSIGGSGKIEFPTYDDVKERLQFLNSDITFYCDDEIFHYFITKYPQFNFRKAITSDFSIRSDRLNKRIAEKEMIQDEKWYISILLYDTPTVHLFVVAKVIEKFVKENRDCFFLIHGSDPRFFIDNLSIYSRSRLIFSAHDDTKGLEDSVLISNLVVLLSQKRIRSDFFDYTLTLGNKLAHVKNVYIPVQIEERYSKNIYLIPKVTQRCIYDVLQLAVAKGIK